MRRRHFLVRLGLGAAWLALPGALRGTGDPVVRRAAAELYPARLPGSEVWGITADPAEASAVFALGAGGVAGLAATSHWQRLAARAVTRGVLEVGEVSKK